jgi:hypothetical protein
MIGLKERSDYPGLRGLRRLNRTMIGLKGQSSADISKGEGRLNRTILLSSDTITKGIARD